MAAIQGINLDDAGQEDVEERFRRARLNASARMSGKDGDQMILEELGFGFESKQEGN